jgi:hypothetical protein
MSVRSVGQISDVEIALTLVGVLSMGVAPRACVARATAGKKQRLESRSALNQTGLCSYKTFLKY